MAGSIGAILSNFIKALIKQAEDKYGPGKGADKKAWVKSMLVMVLQLVEGRQWSSDPTKDRLIDALIEMAVEALQDKGSLPAHTLPPDPVPAHVSAYGNFENIAIPSQADLVEMGYKTGDVVWRYQSSPFWVVTQSGSVPPLSAPDGARVDDVPAFVIGHA